MSWLRVLLLWLAVAPFVGATEDIRTIEVRTLAIAPSPGAPPATHDVVVSLLLFEASRWQPETILAALPPAAALLAQCGVAWTQAELRTIAAPPRFRLYSTPVARELLRRLPLPRPAIVFVDDTLNRPAYDAETVGLANARTRPELAHTIWIAHGARDLPLAMAHELVHLLADSGEHSGEAGNLMRADTMPQNTRLTPAQCAKMRAGAEAQGLAHRR